MEDSKRYLDLNDNLVFIDFGQSFNLTFLYRVAKV
jgi:hypothetical protein